MAIKSKAHQQFYELYLAFFIVIGCLLFSFYSVITVNSYQIIEQANSQALITPLLMDEMKILVAKLHITASFENFYRVAIAAILFCLCSLVLLLHRLNRRWKQTYIEHVTFVNNCIKQHQQHDAKQHDLQDEYNYKEQVSIAEFFETLNTHSFANKVNLKDSLASDNSKNSDLDDSKNTPVSADTVVAEKIIEAELQPSEVFTSKVVAAESELSNNTHDDIAPKSPLEYAEVITHIASINTQNSEQRSLILKELLNELENKIIQVILQNQAEYLTRKSPSLGLYHQLNRLLNWVSSRQLMNHVTSNNAQKTITPTILQTQILGCLYNVSLNNTQHKIPVQFFDLLPHLYTIEVDSNVFNSIVMNTVHLMYVEQRHAHIMLVVNLHEQDDKTCTIGYRFSLYNSQKMNEVPHAINELLTNGMASSLPIVKQLAELLSEFGASKVAIEQEDSGYCLTFNLQHTLHSTIDHTELSRTLEKSTFEYENLVFNTLYLTDYTEINQTENIYTHQIIHNALSCFKGELSLTNSVDSALQHLTEESLSAHKIDLVVVHERTIFNSLMTHMNTLSEALRPKIYLLQDTCQYLSESPSRVSAKLSAPFNKQGFIDDVLVLMQSNNELISNDNLATHHFSSESLKQAGFIRQEGHQYTSAFMKSNIEVLVSIAIDTCLMKLLRLMGFNITIAANHDELLTQWQTGKYLILFTGDESLPVVKLINGKQVKRAIFSSSEQAIDIWRADSFAQSVSWQVEHLANNFILADFKECLSDWFITKESIKIEETKSMSQPTAELAPKAVLNEHKNTVVTEITENTDKKEQPNTDSLSNVMTDVTTDIMNVNDFTLKQISPEFAMMLLEEYSQENTQLFKSIHTAISKEDYHTALTDLDQLLCNAKVLTAKGLLQAVENLIATINNIMVEGESHHLELQLLTLEHETMMMTQYCELI